MPRREFLQLAKTYNPQRNDIGGWYVSDKLDGTRCFWDGGLSRGLPTQSVPFASVIDPNTGHRKAKVKPVATGLWSRYGNPILVPDWFLNQLPCCPLDGELWAGEGNFQLCRSICAGDEPDPRFDRIQYAVYSSPPLERLFQLGEIKNSHMACDITVGAQSWVRDRVQAFGSDYRSSKAANFQEELMFLEQAIECQNDHVYLHRQTKLPPDRYAAQRAAESSLDKVLEKGGEGLIFRDPLMPWTPKRNGGILKYKPFEDAEATIVAFVTGREGKQGHVLGKIGALLCRTMGPKGEVEFEIGTGMRIEEREFLADDHAEWARSNPGSETTSHQGKHFKIGQTITFKYREFSDDGVPKEGRYFRPRADE